MVLTNNAQTPYVEMIFRTQTKTCQLFGYRRVMILNTDPRPLKNTNFE